MILNILYHPSVTTPTPTPLLLSSCWLNAVLPDVSLPHLLLDDILIRFYPDSCILILICKQIVPCSAMNKQGIEQGTQFLVQSAKAQMARKNNNNTKANSNIGAAGHGVTQT